MARILINDTWYEELSPSALYESEYESILLRHSKTIYPDFFAVPFKKTVCSDEGTAQADLAFINMTYQNWWVVEVERSDHSLNGHVLPQVRTLASANYDDSVCEYLCEKSPELDKAKVEEMLKGAQPKVLVIVNRPMPEWDKLLRRYDAELAVVEIFRSEHNEAVFRVNGYRPISSSDVISRCQFDRLIPNLLEIMSPAILPVGEKFTMMYDNGLTYWKRLDIADKVYLVPERHNPLSINEKYELVCCDGNRLELHCVK